MPERQQRFNQRLAAAAWRPVLLALLPLLLTITLVAGWSVQREFERQQEQAQTRLATLAELRTTQVEGWLAQLDAQAKFLSSSQVFADQFVAWVDRGEQAAGDRLMSRLVEFRLVNLFEGVLLADGAGQVLAREQPVDRLLDDILQQAVREAAASGKPVRTSIYRRTVTETPLRLDLVVPLVNTGSPARGVIVLRIDPRRELFPMLAAWPVPSSSGETVLWRAKGERLLALSDGRFRQESAGQMSEPLATSALPTAQVLRGEVQTGQPIRTVDYRGVPVLAMVRPVRGSDWWLVAKQDVAEIEQPAWRHARLVAAAAVLALLGLGLGSRLWLQRQALLQSRRESESQRERLSALGMLDAIARSSHDAIFAKDLQGRYVFYNDAAGRHVGRSAAEVLGRNDVELFGPEAAGALTANDALVRAAAAPQVFEEHLPSPTGELILLCAKGPLFDADGRLMGVYGVSRDVTDMRNAERALRERDAHYRTVVAMLSEGIMLVDPAGRMLLCNPAAERLTGVTQAQWQGAGAVAPGWAVLRDDGSDMPLDATPPGRVLAGGPAQLGVLLRCRHPDGALRWFELSAMPVISPDTGALLAVVTSFIEVTQRKQAEDELARHHERLEELVVHRTRELQAANAELATARDQADAANRAKSAFLANMSHEIRTPMNAIIGLTHLMSRDSRDPQMHDRLAKVDDAARHLLQVINDILDLSKIEAGKMVLEDTEFSLDTLMTRAFEMVRGRAADKGLELVLDTDHLPERLRGDPTRLAQALINLLSNAVKFTQQGFVRLRAELLREDGARLQVRFEVQDTGEGIAADRQQRLFEAFEQADSSATRRHGGTGLGLALSRHLAAMMDGEIGVSSVPGEGSTFWFTAWLGRARPAAETATPVPLQGLRALLVDDLPEARAALGDRLRLLGLQVDAQARGDEALVRVQHEMASGQPYDVLLVDWRMTPLDGIETLRQLRALLGAGMPPSILVTAYDDTAMWQQARAMGCDAVLVKPITASALHDTLARMLRRGPHDGALAGRPVAGASEAALRRHHAGRRVLLVEDNPVNQEVAAQLLRLVGLVVETAGDGAQAVDLALRHHHDLVLMDMQMPVMDGLTATRLIRERAGDDLPIIAMTANAFGEDRQACLAAGMNDHVAKPVDPEALFATLLQWLPARAATATTGTDPGPPAAALVPVVHAVAAARPPLPERLAAIDGFDLADALRHVGGQMPLLLRVLAGFVANYPQGEPALQVAWAAGDTAGLGTACHSLRGACAAIGANGLQARLQAVEAAIDHGQPPPDLRPALRQVQADLLDLVQQLADAMRP